MLSRFDDLPGNLLNEAWDALQRAGIADDDEPRQLARLIICETRATAARLHQNDHAQRIVVTASGLAALMPRPNMVVSPVSSSTPPVANVVQSSWPRAGGVPEAQQDSLPNPTADQARFAGMTPLQAVEEYMKLKPKTGGLGGAAENLLLVQAADVRPGPLARKKSSPKVWGESQRRQFRAAAFLFGKSNSGRPLAVSRQDDLVDLYDAFDRMPSSHHKSPRHEKMTLEEN